jgi:hypothetical protein
MNHANRQNISITQCQCAWQSCRPNLVPVDVLNVAERQRHQFTQFAIWY